MKDKIISNQKGNTTLAIIGLLVVVLMIFMFGIKGILIAFVFAIGCFIVAVTLKDG